MERHRKQKQEKGVMSQEGSGAGCKLCEEPRRERWEVKGASIAFAFW